MKKAIVAIIKTSPESFFEDIQVLLENAGLGKALDSGCMTILKDNLSWHFPFLSANTTPWQLEGTILGLKRSGLTDLVAVHNNTVVTDPFRGGVLNKLQPVYRKYGIPEKYNFRAADMSWEIYRPKAKMRALDRIYPDGIRIPSFFRGKNIVHLPTMKCHIYTTTTGAMKNAFGGLLCSRRHYTHSVIHETLVDLLAIQKEIHSGIFAVMDGSFCGNGPGPRTMIPEEKGIFLASSDSVAIDAVAAKIMGFDPMKIPYISLAHADGLGIGRVDEIEIMGADISSLNFKFSVGDNFASRFGDFFWFSPFKRFQRILFQTPLVYLFIFGSYLYHDKVWWPYVGSRIMQTVHANTEWGRFFLEYPNPNYGHIRSDLAQAEKPSPVLPLVRIDPVLDEIDLKEEMDKSHGIYFGKLLRTPSFRRRDFSSIWFPFTVSLLGIFLIAWACLDARFRTENFISDIFYLPFSVGVALILTGLGIVAKMGRSAAWLSLALTGQAVALLMVEAGPHLRYQHYRPIDPNFVGLHWVELLFFAAQTVLVAVGITRKWSTISELINTRFKKWQIAGIFAVFFFSSATVSPEVKRYVSELLFAFLVQIVNLGNVLLILWAIPDDFFVRWKSRFAAFIGNGSPHDGAAHLSLDGFAFAAAAWVMIVASLLSVFVYERHPHITDEVNYLLHARFIADGALVEPAPPVEEAFDVYLMQFDGDRWYPAPPPGWPAVLAAGVVLGVPWLVNPILGGIGILLAFLIIQELYSRRHARLTVLLLSLSPWYLFMNMSFMAHPLTLTLALASTYCIILSRRKNRAVWAWVAGFGLGAISLVRPMDGLIVAILLGLWSIGLGGKRLKIFSIAGLVLGAVLVGALVLPYNMALTGDPMVMPIKVYTDQRFAPNSFAYGFGPDRGMGWALDPNPGHGPVDALINADLNTYAINVELFGWSTGSLLLLGLMVFSGTYHKSDYLMLSVLIIIFTAYFFFYYSGGPDFGARYWYLMIISIVALSVRGAEYMAGELEKARPALLFHHERAIVGILLMIGIALLSFMPWRATDKYHHYLNMRPDILKLAKENRFGRSLILIRGKDRPDYASAAVYNPLNFKADQPIYAWDKNPEARRQVIAAYPDRPVWIVNGPSLTGKGYEVSAGPLPPSSFSLIVDPKDHGG